MATAVAIVGLALSAFGTVKQASAQKKAAKAQAASEAAIEKRENLKVAREKRRIAMESRASQARIEQGSANTGALTSSAPVGGRGGVSTQGTAAIGFLNSSQQLSGEASAFRQYAYKQQSKAAGYGAIAGLGMTIFGNAERIASFGGGGKSSGGNGESMFTPFTPFAQG